MSAYTIGIFDSGVGGLTVFQALKKRLPSAHYIYLADTAYLPYGSKAPQDIAERTRWGISWLQHCKVDAVVIACHTASSVFPEDKMCPGIFTTISSCVKSIMAQPIHQGVGLIATPLTVRQEAIPNALRAKGFSNPVYSLGCPELVPLIERQEWSRLGSCLSTIQEFFRKNPVDVIYYGCTHYPMIHPFLPLDFPYPLIDPACFLADEVAQYIFSLNKSPSDTIGCPSFYTTGPHHTLEQHLRTQGILANISLIPDNPASREPVAL